MEYTARQPADGYTFVIGNLVADNNIKAE